MKKALSFVIAFLLAFGCFSCIGPEGQRARAESGRLQIVTTIFPLYD